MAKKVTTVADLMGDDRTLEEIEAKQTGSEEVIDGELTKIEQMMNDIAGVKEGDVIYWLHRANEKNKTLHGNFLKRYPRDTPYIDIFEEARDSYNGGDFVLIAKKDGVLYKKAWFTVEKPAGKVVEIQKAPEDPFARLSNSIEKAMIIDRAASVMDGRKATVEIPKGVDPVVGIMTTMLTGMQAQNLEMLKLLMAKKEEPKGGNDALMDAIKLGVSISGGKVPFEEGEGGIMELLKPLIPHIPAVLSMLTGKGPPRPVLNRPATSVPVPAPVPASAPASVLEMPPQGSATPEDAQALVMRRIVDEVKFVMSLPPTPKLREHVIDYIDAYAPDILRQAEMTTAELFAGYVVTLDAAFAGQEAFFIDLHKQYMAGLQEEPADGEGSLCRRKFMY